MKMIFNELSSSFPEDSIEEGKSLMKEFINIYSKARKIGIEDSLIIKDKFDGILLAKEYPIEKWRNDKDIDLDIRRMYKILNDRAQFINDSLEEELSDSEFECEKGISLGCLLAHELDSITISFLSGGFWDTNSINGKIKMLDDSSNIREYNVNILNLSKEEHIQENKAWISDEIKKSLDIIINGQDLWSRKEELFSSLLFCDSSRKDIYKLRKDAEDFEQIKEKLFQIEEYFKNWDGKTFDMDFMPNISPETRATLDMYGKEHEFIAVGGKKIIFSLHIRFTGGDYEGRIYFEPDYKLKKCIIGHVGRKLPTVSWHNP
jgi:hypothetical protein